MIHLTRLAAVGGLIAVLLSADARSADWPGFRGPNRDGICTETGLLRQWPEEGPKPVWRTDQIGEGFSGCALVGSMLFTMGQRDGREWVIALDCANRGNVLWAVPIGPIRHNGGGYGGPRCTPSVYRERVYALGINGDLVCIDQMTGRGIWTKNLVAEFDGRVPKWGYSESPLVDQRWILCTPGGTRATMVALWRANGQKVWASPIGGQAGYSSIVKVSIGGGYQYVQFTADGIVGVQVRGGKLLWRWDQPASETANINTPVWFGQTVFAAGGEGGGSGVVFPYRHGDGEYGVKELYFSKDLQIHHGGAILWGGCLYFCTESGVLTCADYKTGEVHWTDESCGRCSLLFADGMLYVRDETGPVSLVSATPDGFQLHGRFMPPRRSRKQSWTHPIISGGKLYLRERNTLFCYDVTPQVIVD